MTRTKVCNRCGKKLDFWDQQQEFSIHKRLEYGSIYDGETIRYQLCCDCIDRAIDECAVSPIKD